MSLQDSLFSEDVEYDVTFFARDRTRKRALVFPPVNNYRRFIIHQLVQDRFPDLLHTFSIGQGSARRTVVCYKSDVRRDWDPKPNAPECGTSLVTKRRDTIRGMEGRQSPSVSPECKQLQRQAKSAPTVEIYRPPAARRASNCSQMSGTQTQMQSNNTESSSVKNVRQKRPDRAVYVPRHRRSLEERRSRSLKASPANHTTLNEDPNTNNNSRLQDTCCIRQSTNGDSSLDNQISENRDMEIENSHISREILEDGIILDCRKISDTHDNTEYTHKLLEELKEDVQTLLEETKTVADNPDENSANFNLSKSADKVEINDESVKTTQVIVEEENRSLMQHLDYNDTVDNESTQLVEQNVVSDVLVISDNMRKKVERLEQTSPILVIPPEKKVKKIERQKSKPVPSPSPPMKINRDECDWDSLFDDNGDCLDPTLIEELTSAVGEVTIEQPKNDYKTYSKQVEVSSDEFAHVVEIYNFPSEFKTSDLAAVFSSFKNGGFELKWVDDTHCLGVFSSPLVAAEVLASNHPFVKTRPLSEATALSKTKAKRTAEFLQPYRNRPETCAALARRLVTGALGVKLATARQEREHEKNILREAKEKRRLANKQREDVWEGIIPAK
ncbi:Growth inhibition and differentiation-related protein 88-like protein [Camponotus floridanus]|uniref:Growth inhibition and differentiation-related protein 88-like protein n=2 Tax=Camponotus floridanus TaxID=104421 RepID=E2AD29_CAMFO|nr:R3H and coiled-coil domain-containing protein 1 isoform X1 [Camponotus floridanus]EFN68665.1 Growth inhibition and differentiation-related protein 88-like protein [Camponotus floridanus]